ncbi:MAG TPA: class I SAM-dependent methyltransferase [Flavobacteriaceae bacterium]|nr:class I SAM-dependent methyltransferase [Flavobacteriaceae bacterium]
MINSKLHEYYHMKSKHSNYQILSTLLTPYLKDIDVKTRFEKERLKFILKHIELKNKYILDIGGNTGYFTFEFLKYGALHIDYYDGDKAHSLFMNEAKKILKLDEKLKIYNQYYLFKKSDKTYDITLLLNVLHHVGEDYGDINIDKNTALKKIITSLKQISFNTDILIFQLGFNWKANRDYPFFKKKEEMINFIQKELIEYFDVLNIGIAEKDNINISYNLINKSNVNQPNYEREFLNRPIFIMKSKKVIKTVFDK